MTYSGGEPSIRGDILEITQTFYKNNNLEILNFITNGFATEKIVDIIDKILRTCPKIKLIVSFSIDGLEKRHDYIRNVPGGFKKLKKSIEELKKIQQTKYNLQISALTTYSKFNKDQIFELIDYITKKIS